MKFKENISGTKSQIWKHLEWTGKRKGNRLPGHWPGPGCMQKTGCIPAIPNSSLIYHDIIIQTHAHWTKATWRHNDWVNFMPGYRIIVKLQLKMAVNFFYKGFHVTGWRTWYEICIICQISLFDILKLFKASPDAFNMYEIAKVLYQYLTCITPNTFKTWPEVFFLSKWIQWT